MLSSYQSKGREAAGLSRTMNHNIWVGSKLGTGVGSCADIQHSLLLRWAFPPAEDRRTIEKIIFKGKLLTAHQLISSENAKKINKEVKPLKYSFTN